MHIMFCIIRINGRFPLGSVYTGLLMAKPDKVGKKIKV